MGLGASFRRLAGGVLVRTALLDQTNSTAIELGGKEVLLVDPAVEPADLAEIAAWLKESDHRVALGWSTHPHWDHLLWAEALGPTVKRYATFRNADLCARERAELATQIERAAPGHELALCGDLTALDEKARDWPESCRLVAHEAHAPGHGALLLEEEGVLVAGDMVSDIEIPSLDLESPDPLGSYREALSTYEALAGDLSAFVPGHGSTGDRAELLRRIEWDRIYLDEIEKGKEATDSRPRAEWLVVRHQAQAAWCAEHR